MSQRTSPASLTILCLPQQPSHTLLGPMSFDKKSREGEQRDKWGWHLLEHIVAAISTMVLNLRTPTPSTLDPKHCSWQQKEIFGAG